MAAWHPESFCGNLRICNSWGAWSQTQLGGPGWAGSCGCCWQGPQAGAHGQTDGQTDGHQPRCHQLLPKVSERFIKSQLLIPAQTLPEFGLGLLDRAAEIL